jgi:hypothetical protein
MLMESITLPSNVTNTSPYIADHAGLFPPHLPSVIELKSKEKLNGLMSSSLLKFYFRATLIPIWKDAVEVMLEMPMPGFMTTISPIKPAPHIKLWDMTMEFLALLKSNAKIAYQIKDAGHKPKPKYTELINTV